MPFLGILETDKLAHVPGTVILQEDVAGTEQVTGALKHGTGRNAHVVLVPQPSADPNDPLNWPMSKKLTTLGITLWGTILYAAVVSAMLNPAFFVMSIELNTTITALVQATGYQTLVIGVTGPFFSALARKFGKRPIFVAASFICLAANIIGATVNSYQGILASRLLQGFAIAPFESLIFALVSDLFFLHERGVYTAMINFVLAGISNLTAVVSGPIAANLGWRWIYWFLVILGGIHCFLQFLFAPETSYNRDHRYEIDAVVDQNLEGLAELEQKEKKVITTEKGFAHLELTASEQVAHQAASIPKKTFVQELSLFNGTFSKESMLQLVIAPLAVCTNLAILWVVMVTCFFVTFYVVIAFVLAQLFAPPPYLLGPTAIGLLSLGPFIGGTVAAILLALISDPLAKWCARRNNGVYEPEYRIIPMAFGLTAAAGLMAWGAMVEEGLSPYSTATMHGIILFGILTIAIGSSAYAIDSFRSMTSEIFIASMASKNLLIFGFSYFVNNWTAVVGARTAFYVWGGVSFAICLTFPVMYVYGKRYRCYWARKDYLKRWHIITHEE